MNKHLPVEVLQPFTHAGVSYTPGQRLNLPTIDALLLKRQKSVKFTKTLSPVNPSPSPPPEEPEKPKRRYKRRDMQAEETTSLSADRDTPREVMTPTVVETSDLTPDIPSSDD